MASLPMSQSGLRGPKMIPDDQYNMFLTIWGHLGPNLAYKKILGKFTKVLGFWKTPPPNVGKNSQIISFFFESVPKYCYVHQCSRLSIAHIAHLRHFSILCIRAKSCFGGLNEQSGYLVFKKVFGIL